MDYVTVRMETPMSAPDRDDYPPLPPMTTGPAGKCPRCGQGSIFKGFISLKERCEVCGLDLTFADAADGPAFFVMLVASVPILGIVENMSYFTTPGGERVEIFGHGGGQDEAARQGIPFLGEMPLFTEIRKGGDDGVPVVVSQPDSLPAEVFGQIAQQLQEQLAGAA